MHILVHLDGSPASDRSLRTAAHLAYRHGALLRGILMYPDHPPESGDTGAIKAAFLDTAHTLGVGAEWLGGCDSLSRLVNQGFASDLLVTGQPVDPDGMEFVERLIISAGRPVLTVPRAGRYDSCGTRVMVAWSSGREAARALADAIPILQSAHRIWLTTTSSGILSDPSPSLQHDDLVSFLKHHRITADHDSLPGGQLSTGDVLLNRACEEGMDLLVMGAIDVTTGSRPALGKVAAHILRHMTLPVMFSH